MFRYWSCSRDKINIIQYKTADTVLLRVVKVYVQHQEDSLLTHTGEIGARRVCKRQFFPLILYGVLLCKMVVLL